jgi:glucan phosphoethanolaminetransferase (alkaline phosphatase superfamily)
MLRTGNISTNRIFIGIGVNIIVGLAIAVALMAPAFIFPWFTETPLTWFREKYLWMFWAFGFALAGCPRIWPVAGSLGILALLEVTQFGSLAFSGEYITPFAIGLMFVELLEVFETAAAHSLHFFFVPLVVIVPYALCSLALRLTWNRQFKSRWFIVLIIAFLLFPLVRIKTHTDRADIVNFFPTANNPSLVNTLNTYSLWFGVLLPERIFGTRVTRKFAAYSLRELPVDPSAVTIVLIMGESLTPSHMSLFGYDRPTTPFLESLVENPNFVFGKGFSAANATRSSLPMFYTVQYHPLDEHGLQRQDANLFQLAKKRGFTTYYLSAQNSNCLNGVNLSSIDKMVTSESRPELFAQQKDEGLLELLQEIQPAERRFIVVHQRNIHLPYATNTEHRLQFQKYPTGGNIDFATANVNAYDNAVGYADFFYQQVISDILKKSKGEVYFFITSDHGEELGENGHWGHDQLNLDSPSVPIIFYGVGVDAQFISGLRKEPLYTHYEMGKKIAELLGYEIHNPEEEAGVVYVNGVASFGRSGYLRFRRGLADKPEDLQIFR